MPSSLTQIEDIFKAVLRWKPLNLKENLTSSKNLPHILQSIIPSGEHPNNKHGSSLHKTRPGIIPKVPIFCFYKYNNFPSNQVPTFCFVWEWFISITDFLVGDGGNHDIEDCAIFQPNYNYEWVDIYCTAFCYSVCEIP